MTQFIVDIDLDGYEDGNPNDIYHGTDFDEAMKFLNGDD